MNTCTLKILSHIYKNAGMMQFVRSWIMMVCSACREPRHLLTAFGADQKTDPMLGIPAHPTIKRAQKKVQELYGLETDASHWWLLYLYFNSFIQNVRSSEFYYTDQGIISDNIRHCELLAYSQADITLQQLLLWMTLEVGLGGLCSIFYLLCYSNMLKFYRLCFKSVCPKFAHYAQTMPIISRRSKLVCSNDCITLLCTTSQFHHQPQTRPRRLLADLPADYMDHTLAIM